MSVQNVVAIRLVDVEIFHWASKNFDLLVIVTQVIRINPLGNIKYISVLNVMAIHPIDILVWWWTDQPRDHPLRKSLSLNWIYNTKIQQHNTYIYLLVISE